MILFAVFAFAEIPAEMEGMEAGVLGNGTYLTTGPTYTFDRPSRQGGIHSASEEWTPGKTRDRILLNRFVPNSWNVQPAGVWLATGNEVGDLMYQSIINQGYGEGNRTPMMEVGFRTPNYKGFWVTARFIQADHFSTSTLRWRDDWIGDWDYALFGENLPFMSSAYAGIGYDTPFSSASILAGTEYYWVYGESGRWIPVHNEPRVEWNFNDRLLHFSYNWEKQLYQNKAENEKGWRSVWNTTLRLMCDRDCDDPLLLGVGFHYRSVKDSGTTYFGLRDNRVIFPFAEFVIRPLQPLEFSGFAGWNQHDWMVKDSVELRFEAGEFVRNKFGIKNHLGSSLNPMGEDYEFFGEDTLRLFTDGYMQLHRLYLDVGYVSPRLKMGIHTAGWIEKGAETFEPDAFHTVSAGREKYSLRTGNVSRIDSWIRGFSAEADVKLWYREMFSFGGRFGFERIDGARKRFEVEPVEKWVQLDASWIFKGVFHIDHSWFYRSDAAWNLRTEEPFVVKGGWFWNMSLSQRFPEYNLALTGTILHALTEDDKIQVPNGGYDRTRFFCRIQKMF